MITPFTVKVGTKLRFRDPMVGHSAGSTKDVVTVAKIMPSTIWWTDREDGQLRDFVSWDIADNIFEIVPAVDLAMALRQIMDVAADYTVPLPIPAMRMYEIARDALTRMTP